MKNTDNTTLFDLTGNLLRLYEMMDDPDIEPDVLIDTMEAVEGEFEAKAEGKIAQASLQGGKRFRESEQIVDNHSGRNGRDATKRPPDKKPYLFINKGIGRSPAMVN